jgi:3D (Asp-Asp-Asp) domain-containing protein
MYLKRITILVIHFYLISWFIEPAYVASKEIGEIMEIEVTATAYYTPEINQEKYVCGSYKEDRKSNGARGRTSSGTIPKSGTVAADPNIFPLGTILYVPGYGMGRVEDVGCDIKGPKIDVHTGSGDAGRMWAQNWGVKRLTVKIIPSS